MTRLEHVIELWAQAQTALRACIHRLDKIISVHPGLPPIQMELQSMRVVMTDAALELREMFLEEEPTLPPGAS